MSLKYLEVGMCQLTQQMPALLKGEITALLVQSSMSTPECHVVYHNFIKSKGLYKREDGVPAMMVGANTFLRNTDEAIAEMQKNNVYAELLFHGTRNIYCEIFDAIADAGFRFRRAYINGTPAPQYRGTIWDNTDMQDTPLLMHTDWPQVRHSEHEFKNVRLPVAINFYAKHPEKGHSYVRLYDLIPSQTMLHDLNIAASGYPIKPEALSGIDYLDIAPAQGDILFFNAAHVHAVKDLPAHHHDDKRLNINGFLGLCPKLNRVLSWV